MKHYIKLFGVLILASFITFISCSENSQEPQIDTTSANYFPNTDGSTYTYNLEITDSLGTVVTGERTATYNSSILINNSTYQILVDEFSYSSNSISDSSYFRKTDTKVYYLTDNSQVLMLLPDSVKSLVVVDAEAGLLQFPLSVGTRWQVYRLAINYGFIIFNVINVTASAELVENISLTVNDTPFNQEAIKLKFQMSVAFDMTTAPLIYYAEAWMVDGIGLVKLEGDSEAINFMIGNNLFLPGGYIKQTLKQYSIP